MRQPVRSKPNSVGFLQIRLSGELRNEVIDHCESLGCGLNAWLVELVKSGLRSQKGLPEPPPAAAPIPTSTEQIRSWLAGEQVLSPCGEPGICEGMNLPHATHGGMSFCGKCGIRVS